MVSSKKSKVCSQCNKRYSVDMFSRHKSTKDGLRSKCKHCRTLEVRNWRKTGKTFVNEFDGKSIDSLSLIFSNLKEAYLNKGYDLTLTKLK
jgi:hypothetical protein